MPWREVSVFRPGLMTATLVSASFAACASFGRKPAQPDLEARPEIRADYRVEALRTHLREYSITFAAAVDLTASAIQRRGSATRPHPLHTKKSDTAGEFVQRSA